jgi:DNA-binding Lrp family transcriptional regulator
MSATHALPVTPRAEAPDDAAVARIVTRLSSDYVLRAFQLLIDSFGDIRAGLLVQAINLANISHIEALAEENVRAAGASGIFPDEMRRPISIARLADSAGMPFENVRRLVQHLVDNGACAKIEGGVIVPRACLERPETLQLVIANLGYVRRFVRDLHAAGFSERLPASLLEAPNQAAPDLPATRLVARRSTEYILRALQLLTETYGDIRTGIVAQTIVAANTSHLDARTGEGWRYAGVDQRIPDEVRRPVSVVRIAESLGLPYETMRRQVERLLDAGICIRLPAGLIIPAAVLDRPGPVAAMLVNVGYVRKFVRELRAPGL